MAEKMVKKRQPNAGCWEKPLTPEEYEVQMM